MVAPLAGKSKQIIVISGLLLALLLTVTAAPLFTGSAEFTGDDYYYVADNPRVNQPGFAHFAEIWRHPMKIEYFPVTVTTYALEYRLWGKSVKLYHVSNFLIFCGIGLVAYSLARRLVEVETHWALPLLATMFLLCHPINVESVASISNRKELLYVFFGLLMLRLYSAAPRRPVAVAGALGCQMLAQLSKGSGVVLPLLLLIYELFREDESHERRRRLIALTPFFVLAAALFAIQIQVAIHGNVVETITDLGPLTRLGGVIRTFNTMLTKFLAPVNLSYDYDLPWPDGLPPVTEWVLPVVVLGGLIFLASTRRTRLLMLICLVLTALVPYLNIVPLHHNVRGQIVFYDHYLLLSSMLCAPLLTVALSSAGERWRRFTIVALLVATLGFMATDYRLYSFWKTRETLYQRVISMSPDLAKGYLFLGKLYNEQQRYGEAREVLAKGLATNHWFPVYIELAQQLGDANLFSGRFGEAEAAYRLHLQYVPRDRISLQSLTQALIEQGNFTKAREIILHWLQYYPDDPDARYSLRFINGKN